MAKVPAYRLHKPSGRAVVTINGRDHYLGKHNTHSSKQAYKRLIAEFDAADQSASFGKLPDSLLMEDLLLAYLRHAKVYYKGSTEYENLKLVERPLAELYGSVRASRFGPAEFKAVRSWWLSDKSRSRQYINKQMKRTLRIIKWAVGEGMMPAANHQAIKCVEPLRKGRCTARESKPITCVDIGLVEATLPYLTQVVADMVRFQLLVGCRPGEVCKIKAGMVDRSSEVWQIELDDHKTAYRGKSRIIYVGPQAQNILRPYLLRPASAYCFSAIESERQRRAARTAA